MDEGVQKLQHDLSVVEYEAELLLLTRQELVESLTALRKIARTSQSSVPMLNEEGTHFIDKDSDITCKTCGSHDGSEPLWILGAGGDFFVSLPFHETHMKLEDEQTQLNLTVNKLQSKVKEKTLSLSEKGALADKIGLKSLIILVIQVDQL
ncbi:hypothetical protein KP509_37G011900 [Ceratopteris richardii]|uniref:P53 and DNA damage-regulated protein 1 n=1 Tax=Ceratopteris richardii TaxID=49495 RepID=A0A8T2Q6G5_CERRI|nr:hypothetical protein KP509_37G011900 [Ceratopteris richardii]